MVWILEANQNIQTEFANNFMGGVQISGNIKKESVRIDPSGNIINPKTREVIKKAEVDEIPPVINTTLPTGMPERMQPKSKIDEMINKLVEKKVEELVAKKVEEALKNL